VIEPQVEETPKPVADVPDQTAPEQAAPKPEADDSAKPDESGGTS
jgi:hypothetical protein